MCTRVAKPDGCYYLSPSDDVNTFMGTFLSRNLTLLVQLRDRRVRRVLSCLKHWRSDYLHLQLFSETWNGLSYKDALCYQTFFSHLLYPILESLTKCITRIWFDAATPIISMCNGLFVECLTCVLFKHMIIFRYLPLLQEYVITLHRPLF